MCFVALCRYPTNPVLRVITPQDTARNLDIYPVKMTQDAIMVDVTDAASTKFKSSRGGSETSIDANNVFAIQPRVYVEGRDSPDGALLSLTDSGMSEGRLPWTPESLTSLLPFQAIVWSLQAYVEYS